MPKRTVVIDSRRWASWQQPPMRYPAYAPALRLHLDSARPRSALESDSAAGAGRWSLRRMLAWAVGVSLALYLAGAWIVTLLVQLARY